MTVRPCVPVDDAPCRKRPDGHNTEYRCAERHRRDCRRRRLFRLYLLRARGHRARRARRRYNPAVPRREGKRGISTFSRAGAGVPPLARGTTVAAGPPHGASVKVSDANAFANVAEREKRVRASVTATSSGLVSHFFMIPRGASSRILLRRYTELFSSTNDDTVVGCRIKRTPSTRFVRIHPLSKEKVFLLGEAMRHNDARQRRRNRSSGGRAGECISFLINEKFIPSNRVVLCAPLFVRKIKKSF